MKKTKVLFLHEKHSTPEQPEVYAYFPDADTRRNGSTVCTIYSHIGQHSEAALSYVKKSRLVLDPKEFEALAEELTNLCGYNLIVENTKIEHLIPLLRATKKTWFDKEALKPDAIEVFNTAMKRLKVYSHVYVSETALWVGMAYLRLENVRLKETVREYHCKLNAARYFLQILEKQSID